MRRTRTIGRGDVLMCLALAGYNRTRAAQLAGVTRQTFQHQMRRCRVKAPVLGIKKKLTANDVRLIRALLDAQVPGCEIARKFEVGHATIHKIKTGRLHRLVG